MLILSRFSNPDSAIFPILVDIKVEETPDEQANGRGRNAYPGSGRTDMEDSHRLCIHSAIHVRMRCRKQLETRLSAVVEGRCGWASLRKGSRGRNRTMVAP